MRSRRFWSPSSVRPKSSRAGGAGRAADDGATPARSRNNSAPPRSRLKSPRYEQHLFSSNADASVRPGSPPVPQQPPDQVGLELSLVDLEASSDEAEESNAADDASVVPVTSLNPEEQVAAAAERARTRVGAGGWTPEVQKFYREVMDVARATTRRAENIFKQSARDGRGDRDPAGEMLQGCRYISSALPDIFVSLALPDIFV